MVVPRMVAIPAAIYDVDVASAYLEAEVEMGIPLLMKRTAPATYEALEIYAWR